MREVILRLLHKPAFGTSAKNLFKTHSHLRRNAALFIHQLGKRVARYTQGGGGLGDVQTQRLDALAQNDASGVGWILHDHGLFSLSSGNRLNQRPRPVPRQNEKSPASSLARSQTRSL